MKRFPWISLALLLVCYAGFGWYLSGLELARSPWLTSTCYHLIGQPQPPESQPFFANGKPLVESEKSAGSKKGIESEKIAVNGKSADGEKSGARSAPEGGKGVENKTAPEGEKIADGKTAAEGKKIAASETTIEGGKPLGHANFCDLAIQHNLQIGFITVGWIFISAIAFISPLSSFNRFLSRWFRSDTVAFATIFLLAGLATIILYWLHVVLQIVTILAAEALGRIDIQSAGMTGSQAYWILTLVSLTGLTVGWLANGVL